MLLDSYSLKNGLSSLLSPAPAGFTKRLNQSFQKVDTILKTIQVLESPPEALVQAYLIHIADKSDANFRTLLEIKGIRSKQEQNRLVELFQIHKASDRHASNLQQSNPLISHFQSQAVPGHAPTSSVSQGLGLGIATSANPSAGGGGVPGRFDASTLGSALMSAARDGVDRLGTPGLGTLSTTGASGSGGRGLGSASQTGTVTPSAGIDAMSTQNGENVEGGASGTTSNLNENLKNIGKFFRRDLGGLGGRFGRAAEDGSSR